MPPERTAGAPGAHAPAGTTAGTPAAAGTTGAPGFREALARLRGAQKSARGGPPYSIFVNRPLGRVLAALAYVAGLTPNQVTALSAVATFAGIVLLALAPATWATGIGVALLLVLGYALDSADGQLARLRGGGSLLGEWLDHTVDSLKVVVVHMAVLVTWFLHLDLAPGWLVVPLAFAAASSVHFFGMILVDLLGRTTRAELGVPAPAKTAPGASSALLKLPTDYGVLCLAMLLLGAHAVFVGVYTFLAAATVGYTLLVVLKWRRDVVALDRLRAEARADVA
ncbi:CDP-alcohol phosphatidyltransferase family protein [Microlunatus flavus]|uniref:Phosphatidylglycerophosphate synthase n=1 Tax=Microlunatus flavus TaxID=1036181 RepID=A0A1H8ZBZ9_9ACTN|nr:CDP-alcohol phosphatidyltransferase family protein [Microlunatus flavus]SEP61925.1 Phosphatidylglycerophosphate synthase [Microlunatus flavus]